jgi:aquaporin Z
VSNVQSRGATFQTQELSATAGAGEALSLHWREYVFEGLELGAFMFGACTFGTLLFYPHSPLVTRVPSPVIRHAFMGIAMGGLAIAIILSPMGRRSGAHFNPIVSFTFFFLGRMHRLDAMFYTVAQFAGGALGVLAARLLLGSPLASPSVNYVVTVPGHHGLVAAFLAEWFMGLLTMTVVLQSGNHVRLARFSWLWVGLLVTLYVIAFSSVSGFSQNPARTAASALFAGVWTAMWLYFTAPLLGMLLAALIYVRTSGPESVHCAKIYHDLHSPCPFRCRFRKMVPPETSTSFM